MIIRPQSKGFVCLTAHPIGCARNVQNQIAYVRSTQKQSPSRPAPKRALIIGSSTGYGLSSRIMAGFGLGAETIGIFTGKPAQDGRTASPGWYNTAAFERFAAEAGLRTWSLRGDAFSDETKRRTLTLIKETGGPVDLVVYSLAAPRRTHPQSGEVFTSVLKPILRTYRSKTVHFQTSRVTDVSFSPATSAEINSTVAVMGGEDWALWIDALIGEGLLAPGTTTLAFSYAGPALTEPIYRRGTIGRAKDHLEATARLLNSRLAQINGRATVAVMKALVTQASAAIPVMPLYVSLLFKAMKARALHEGCPEQIVRLFSDHLFADHPPATDEKARVRLDDWELREDVQRDVARRWERVDSHNVERLADLEGYRKDFFQLFGFGEVDVSEDVDPAPEILSMRVS